MLIQTVPPVSTLAQEHGAHVSSVPVWSWLMSPAAMCTQWYVDTHRPRVFYNQDECTDSNTAGDMSGCSGTPTPTLGPKDPTEGPTQGRICPQLLPCPAPLH